MDELYADWLKEEVVIPWRLAEGLSLPERVMRQKLVAALAKELGFDPDRADWDIDTLLDDMVWPLNDLLEAGTSIFENPNRHRTIARDAVSGRSTSQLIAMAEGLGWSKKTAVGERVIFGKLDRVVADSFGKLLSDRIYEMLRGWDKRKVFERTRLGLIPRRTA